MPQRLFDAATVRDAMRAFLATADALDAAAAIGADPRDLLDLAEAKTVAGLALRKRLEDAGWTAPTSARAGTPAP